MIDSLGEALTAISIIILLGGLIFLVLSLRDGSMESEFEHRIDLEEEIKAAGDSLESRALAFSMLICNAAFNAVKDIKAGNVTDIKLSPRDEGLLLYEFLILFIHYLDRLAYSLGKRLRAQFMDQVAKSVSSQLMQLFNAASKKEIKTFLQKKMNEEVDDLLVEYKARQDFRVFRV